MVIRSYEVSMKLRVSVRGTRSFPKICMHGPMTCRVILGSTSGRASLWTCLLTSRIDRDLLSGAGGLVGGMVGPTAPVAGWEIARESLESHLESCCSVTVVSRNSCWYMLSLDSADRDNSLLFVDVDISFGGFRHL